MRFDDLANQIFRENLILVVSDKDVLKDIKDEEYEKDGKKIKVTAEEKKERFYKEIKKYNLPSVNNEIILHKFELKRFNKLIYSRFKELSRLNYFDLVTNELLFAEFNREFNNFFKKIVYFGDEFDFDVDSDLKLQLEISLTFISIFEKRLYDLKKKFG